MIEIQAAILELHKGKVSAKLRSFLVSFNGLEVAMIKSDLKKLQSKLPIMQTLIRIS